jgi:hypothetical protein
MHLYSFPHRVFPASGGIPSDIPNNENSRIGDWK